MEFGLARRTGNEAGGGLYQRRVGVATAAGRGERAIPCPRGGVTANAWRDLRQGPERDGAICREVCSRNERKTVPASNLNRTLPLASTLPIGRAHAARPPAYRKNSVATVRCRKQTSRHPCRRQPARPHCSMGCLRSRQPTLRCHRLRRSLIATTFRPSHFRRTTSGEPANGKVHPFLAEDQFFLLGSSAGLT